MLSQAPRPASAKSPAHLALPLTMRGAAICKVVMDAAVSSLGIIGAALCVGVYVLVSAGKISATRPAFYAANGAGSLLVLLAAAFSFDPGDLGALFQEIVWVFVSAFGWLKWRGASRAANAGDAKREKSAS